MKPFPSNRRVCIRAAAILLVATVVAVALQFTNAHAAGTFTVNSLGDTPDAVPGNGLCADAGGACTLRAAIEEANSNSIDTDTINISVTGTIPGNHDVTQSHSVKCLKENSRADAAGITFARTRRSIRSFAVCYC